jgi:hypothetical protein
VRRARGWAKRIAGTGSADRAAKTGAGTAWLCDAPGAAHRVRGPGRPQALGSHARVARPLARGRRRACLTPAALAASIWTFWPSQSTFSGVWPSFHRNWGLEHHREPGVGVGCGTSAGRVWCGVLAAHRSAGTLCVARRRCGASARSLTGRTALRCGGPGCRCCGTSGGGAACPPQAAQPASPPTPASAHPQAPPTPSPHAARRAAPRLTPSRLNSFASITGMRLHLTISGTALVAITSASHPLGGQGGGAGRRGACGRGARRARARASLGRLAQGRASAAPGPGGCWPRACARARGLRPGRAARRLGASPLSAAAAAASSAAAMSSTRAAPFGRLLAASTLSALCAATRGAGRAAHQLPHPPAVRAPGPHTLPHPAAATSTHAAPAPRPLARAPSAVAAPAGCGRWARPRTCRAPPRPAASPPGRPCGRRRP